MMQAFHLILFGVAAHSLARKPGIRRTAKMGDWIVGLSPKAKGNRVVYAMRVDEILPFERYYRDPRFADKIPDSNKGEAACEFGDNIYKPLICNPQRNDDFEQRNRPSTARRTRTAT